MIEYTTINWKNILSYGNNTTTFDFRNGIFKLSALNGAGKSSLIDALHFALFGTPYRKIKLGQLVNSKNKKGLLVNLNFTIQDDVYRIERGLKPDIFKIFKNDELVPVSSSKRGYQEILEEDILKYNSNLFNQVTVKSLTKNLSFMTLPKAEKRNIIENLLDIECFTIMNKNVKGKIDAIEIDLKSIKKDIDNTQLLIETEEANLETILNLKKKMESETEQNILAYTTEITQLKSEIEKYNKGLEIIKKKKIKKGEIEQDIKAINTIINAHEENVKKYESIILLNDQKVKFLSKTCGSCPKIKELSEDKDISGYKKDLSVAIDIICNKRLETKEFNKELNKINEILMKEYHITTNKQAYIKRIDDLETKISRTKAQVITVDRSKLKGYNTKKIELEESFNKQAKMKTHYQTLRLLFSDDGVKSQIIKKYLPHINKLLNHYLAKFSASMVFNFDSEFNEVVLTKYKEDFSYFSFSEGEKKRIDLAVLFSFIKFAMQKNRKSDTNLLIFDEVTSGLDEIGADALYATMKEYRNQYGKCIININHNDIGGVEYDQIYECKIDKGFSQMTEVEL